MKKLLAMIIAIICLVFTVSGCGLSDNVAESSMQSGEYVEEVRGQEDKTPAVITVAQTKNDAARSENLKLIAEKYTADHPHITINFVNIPADAQEGIAMIEASKEIDIVEVDDLTLTHFAKKGALFNIREDIRNWDEMFKFTHPGRTAMRSTGEAYYAVPHTTYQDVMYYRKEALLEQGCTVVPTKYYLFYDVGVKLTHPEKGKYAWAFAGAENLYQIADMMIWSETGIENVADRYFGYYTKGGNGETIFSKPETKEALLLFKKWYKDLADPAAVSWTREEAIKAFTDGNAEILLMDSKAMGECAEKIPMEDWDTWPVPLGSSDFGIQHGRFEGWGVSANSQNQEKAVDFLFFLTNQDNGTFFAKVESAVPAHVDAIENDSYFMDLDENFRGFMVLGQRMAKGSYKMYQAPKMYNKFLEYPEYINDRYRAFLTDKIDIDTLMQEQDAFWSEAYKEEGQLWKEAE
jgi:ABC-type sugar transport system, periplasmic component